MATTPLRWMTATTSEALMARVARGDEPAYRTLTRRHLPAMLGLARRILVNAADAEDVAREPFAGLDPCAELAATGGVSHLAHARCGQSLSRPQTACAMGRLGSGRRDRGPDTRCPAKAEHDERERLVAAAIAELPVRQRSAIVLTYGDGMSNAQVAEIFDTSVSAVETLLVRGKRNLRARSIA